MAEMVKSYPKGEGTELMPSPIGRGGPGAVGEEAKEAVSNVAGQAKDLVSGQVARQAERSANDISDVARALRQTKDQLGDNFAAPIVDRAADQLERFSRFLRTADANQVLRGVETFARREPLVFLGGAFALGMLGARFLKSSSQHGAGWSGSRMPERGSRQYGATGGWYGGQGASGGSSEIRNTGPRGTGELAGTGQPDVGATAPDPRGDYPPNSPPGGPYPGSGVAPMEREGRGRAS